MQNGHQAIDNSQECLGHWNLGIGIWDFKPIMVVVDCFNLTGLFQPGRFPGLPSPDAYMREYNMINDLQGR